MCKDADHHQHHKSYERAINVAPTGGFANDAITNFKQDSPDDKFFEPSPIIVGNFGSNLAWVTGVLNVLRARASESVAEAGLHAGA